MRISNILSAGGTVEVNLLESSPPELQTSLPTIEQIERELADAGVSGEEEKAE